MRLVNSMGLGTLLVLGSTKLALAMQDAPVQIDVKTTESHTVWYTNPVWLAIGGLAVLLVIAMAVMSGRSSGSSTTVVR